MNKFEVPLVISKLSCSQYYEMVAVHETLAHDAAPAADTIARIEKHLYWIAFDLRYPNSPFLVIRTGIGLSCLF